MCLIQHWWKPGWWREGTPLWKGKGISIVCVRSVNFKFWMHSGCSGSKSILFGREGHDFKFFYFSLFPVLQLVCLRKNAQASLFLMGKLQNLPSLICPWSVQFSVLQTKNRPGQLLCLLTNYFELNLVSTSSL